MNESKVWRSILTLAKELGWKIICASPPGASGYLFQICRLKDSNGNNDEPDLMFVVDRKLFIAEFKGTFPDLLRMNRKNENDILKLQRIQNSMISGVYDKQLVNNFNINPKEFIEIKIAIGYGGEPANQLRELVHLVVNKKNNEVRILGQL